MSYSENEPFKNREHMVAEVGYCGRMAWYITILSLVCMVVGIASDLLDTRLLLGSTTWLLLAVVTAVLSIPPQMYRAIARHLLGMELIKKDQA